MLFFRHVFFVSPVRHVFFHFFLDADYNRPVDLAPIATAEGVGQRSARTHCCVGPKIGLAAALPTAQARHGTHAALLPACGRGVLIPLLVLRFSFGLLRVAYFIERAICAFLLMLMPAFFLGSPDSEYLAEFFAELDGANWADNTNWEDDTVGLWEKFGVTNTTNGNGTECVRYLSLPSNNLVGESVFLESIGSVEARPECQVCTAQRARRIGCGLRLIFTHTRVVLPMLVTLCFLFISFRGLKPLCDRPSPARGQFSIFACSRGDSGPLFVFCGDVLSNKLVSVLLRGVEFCPLRPGRTAFDLRPTFQDPGPGLFFKVLEVYRM